MSYSPQSQHLPLCQWHPAISVYSYCRYGGGGGWEQLDNVSQCLLLAFNWQQSVFWALLNNYILKGKKLTENINTLAQTTYVVLQWIPAHTGIQGNEMADQLAKEGREKEQSPSHLSYRELKTLIHNKKKAFFHCKTEGYNPNQDALHQLAQHQQTIIFHLRTGHCRLNSHLKRIGVKTSAQCPCGEADQIPEHYLQSCSLHQQARQQIWPTCVSPKPSSGGLQRICSWHPDMRHSREKGSSQRNHHIERERRRRILKGVIHISVCIPYRSLSY